MRAPSSRCSACSGVVLRLAVVADKRLSRTRAVGHGATMGALLSALPERFTRDRACSFGGPGPCGHAPLSSKETPRCRGARQSWCLSVWLCACAFGGSTGERSPDECADCRAPASLGGHRMPATAGLRADVLRQEFLDPGPEIDLVLQ